MESKLVRVLRLPAKQFDPKGLRFEYAALLQESKEGR